MNSVTVTSTLLSMLAISMCQTHLLAHVFNDTFSNSNYGACQVTGW